MADDKSEIAAPAALRASLASGVVRAMATHSPLSARLAVEAGFGALWASGFELSALYGLPDVSLVSMAEHLEMTRRICAAVDVPVVADVDTGFGNAINVLHTVEQYERAGAAAVVIEDKTFPKVTSLVDGGRQELLPIPEFQGKIEAACEARASDDFVIVARTEALIAGLGVDVALERARAYVSAGADLILIHSKQPTPDEVELFIARWDGRASLVVVPTSYPAFTPERAEQTGKVGVYIYGNHAIRAATAGMQAAFSRIMGDDDGVAITDTISPVTEIFRLQGMAAVKDNEQRYLR